MNISAINSCNCPKPHFTSNGYENPINKNTEKNLAIWTSVGGSAIVGATAAGIASCFETFGKGVANRGWKLGAIGVAGALIMLALTLPSKLYNTKVNATAREKEMDVFVREKDLKSNIMEEVNNEVKDEDVSLDDKVNHYATVQMASNGNGVMVKGA